MAFIGGLTARLKRLAPSKAGNIFGFLDFMGFMKSIMVFMALTAFMASVVENVLELTSCDIYHPPVPLCGAGDSLWDTETH